MSKNKQKSISEKLVFQIKLFFRKYPSLPYILKWTLICSFIGVLIGSASAGFLQSLNWATDFRENHLWLREIEFLQELPNTVSGKIRRVELRQLEEQRKLGKEPQVDEAQAS